MKTTHHTRFDFYHGLNIPCEYKFPSLNLETTHPRHLPFPNRNFSTPKLFLWRLLVSFFCGKFVLPMSFILVLWFWSWHIVCNWPQKWFEKSILFFMTCTISKKKLLNVANYKICLLHFLHSCKMNNFFLKRKCRDFSCFDRSFPLPFSIIVHCAHFIINSMKEKLVRIKRYWYGACFLFYWIYIWICCCHEFRHTVEAGNPSEGDIMSLWFRRNLTPTYLERMSTQWIRESGNQM